MKNWEPLVFGPEFAIESVPARNQKRVNQTSLSEQHLDFSLRNMIQGGKETWHESVFNLFNENLSFFPGKQTVKQQVFFSSSRK